MRDMLRRDTCGHMVYDSEGGRGACDCRLEVRPENDCEFCGRDVEVCGGGCLRGLCCEFCGSLFGVRWDDEAGSPRCPDHHGEEDLVLLSELRQIKDCAEAGRLGVHCYCDKCVADRDAAWRIDRGR